MEFDENSIEFNDESMQFNDFISLVSFFIVGTQFEFDVFSTGTLFDSWYTSAGR